MKKHEHKWSRVGLYMRGERGLCLGFPCMDKDCEAYIVEGEGVETLIETGWPLSIHGKNLKLNDNEEGGVAKIICREIERDYQLHKIPFEPKDKVIDIGAHVGVVSIALAKLFPEIHIYAFEPCEENFINLVGNAMLNDVSKQISPFNMGVTKDGRQLALKGSTEENSGGISAFTSDTRAVNSNNCTTTLDAIMFTFNIHECKLLKIDCEGAEYEILYNTPVELLKKVLYFAGEFHINTQLEKEYGPNCSKKLAEYIYQHIPNYRCKITHCRMGD